MAQLDQPPPPLTSKHEASSDDAPSTLPNGAPELSPSPATMSPAIHTGENDRTLNASAGTSQPHQTPPPPSHSTPNVVVPQPKKFSAVNIGKKFLEKNSAAPAHAPATSTSVAAKTNGVQSRPVLQTPSTSHSRLVTTRLTVATSIAPGVAQGWSRPSSVTPSAPSPPGPSNGGASSATAQTATHPSHGKSIPPHSTSSTGFTKEHGSSRAVWGNQRSNSATPSRESVLRNDFPTAAEVAQESSIRKNKERAAASREPAPPSAGEQARMAEADTFRGLHLDPAHHWDEMEENDDTFFDNIIEFGDGRQYKVETSEDIQSEDKLVAPEGPVSKEERFEDDFDRSWPPSKPSPSLSTRPISRMSSTAATSPVLRNAHSPDTSKVLFNERSNKLEPLHASRQPMRRTGPPSEHKTPSENMQGARSKQGSSIEPHRQRGYGDHSTAHDRHRERDPPSRLDTSNGHISPIARESDGRTISPSLSSFRRTPRDGTRQLPPHLSQMPPPPPSQRMVSSGSRAPSLGDKPTATPHPPQLSPLSTHSQLATSPVLERSHVALGGAHGELEDVRKDLMADAAARAKKRRQQEEEEREKERERARKKAAELEARLKAQQTASQPPQSTEQQAVAFIEEAIDSVNKEHEPTRRSSVSSHDGVHSLPRRPPSLRGSTRPPLGPQKVSASDTDSWRSKAHPLPPAPAPAPSQLKSPQLNSRDRPLLGTPLSVLDHVSAITDKGSEELEVVDFSDLGHFVGGSSPDRPVKPPRPTASQFFDDDDHSTELQEAALITSPRIKTHSSAPSLEQISEHLTLGASSPGPATRAQRAVPSYKEPAMSTLDDVMSRIKGALSGMQANESPKEPSTRKTSVPDPTGLHAVEISSSEPSKPVIARQRWLPPAMRAFNGNVDCEGFTMSSDEPPQSPQRESFAVRLPEASRYIEPLNRRQLMFSKMPPIAMRWDIMSWDPPVEGMNRRDLSLDAVLFRKQPVFKGKFRHRVYLPRSRFQRGPMPPRRVPTESAAGATLTIPGINGAGAFGRQRGADQVNSWRKPASPLDVPATSPLRDNDSDSQPGISSKDSDGASHASPRQKSQPKMPAGSGVAIRRDSRIDVVDSNTTSLVTFIVCSELDEQGPGKASDSLSHAQVKPEPTLSQKAVFDSPTSKVVPNMTSKSGQSGSALFSELKSQTTSPVANITPLNDTRADNSSTEDSMPVTPSARHSASTWAKSPLTFSVKEPRSAVPEQIKAAWSQASDKSQIPLVNSLEGIADDLTSLPFTLQDVKSEDGRTPPPTIPTGPSRMAFDVSRAFQQVPESSSSPMTHAPTPLPPPMHAMAPNRTPSFMGPPAGAVRPGYGPYPSPMLSHSPSPGVPYPHSSPIPGRMIVQPMYAQHMWSPMAPRPVSTQYNPGHPMMAYASTPQPMYAQPTNMASPMAQQPPMNNGSQGRGRGIIGSPALSQPHLQPGSHSNMPMYTGSPVLMHSPMIQLQAPPGQSYMAVGQPPHMRQNGLPNNQRPMQPPHLPSSGYAPMPSLWRS